MAELRASEAELRSRLKWLINLRFIAVAGLLGGALALRWFPEVRLAPGDVLRLAIALALANGAFWLFHQRYVAREGGTRLPAVFANVQILVDLVALSTLVAFSGGARSPFALYYVFHMIIASTLLTRRASYAQAAVASALFALVAWTMTPLRPAAHEPYFLPQRILLCVFALTSTLFVAVYMATSIVQRLRERESEAQKLAEELGNKARQLQGAYQSLEQTQQLQTQYMRKVAHELRSPLAAMATTLGVVLQGIAGEVGEKQREMIQRAETKARQLLATVDRLLDLTHSRTARLPHQLREVDVAHALDNVMELMMPEAERSGVRLALDVAHGLPTLRADPESVNHILTNLISNGIKYTPRGGEVSVRLFAEDGQLVLCVRDTGIGIEQSELERIFDEFYRSPRAREIDRTGTGLGLAIVKSAVESLGGTIEVQSTVGKGTTFTVRLPAARQGAA